MTDLVSVTATAGSDLATALADSTLRLRWLSCTPWIASPFITYISREGGIGKGVTHVNGRDNAVCTLTGYMLWTSSAETLLALLGGARVTVSNGVTTKSAYLGAVTVSEAVQGHSIKFAVDARAV